MKTLPKTQLLSDDQLLNHVFGALGPLQGVLVGFVLMCSQADRQRLAALSASAHAFSDLLVGAPLLLPKGSLARVLGLGTIAVLVALGISAGLVHTPLGESPAVSFGSSVKSSSATLPVRALQPQSFAPAAKGQSACQPCHNGTEPVSSQFSSKSSSSHSLNPSSYQSLFPTVRQRNSPK